MRILFLIDSLGTGGAERSSLDLCLHLRSSNHTVKIVCLRRREEGVEHAALKSGIEILFLRSKSLFPQLVEINQICRTFKPHVVHATLFKSRSRARLHKILYAGKYALVESLVTLPFSDSRVTNGRFGHLKVWLHRVLESALSPLSVRRFVAISNEVKNHYLKEVFLLKKPEISVIYRGREENGSTAEKVQWRQRYSAELGYRPDSIVCIHIGRQDSPKNHEFLIRTFLKLDEGRLLKPPIVLLCLGRKGDCTPRINKLLEGKSITNIYFLDHRHDVEQLLCQSDIFLFPSLYEGLGGAVIEAKAAALPIIVSNLEVFRELLRPDEEAFFTELKEEEWVSKVKYLVQDEALRYKMGQNNLESFRRKFLAETVNEAMVRLYEEVTNESSAVGDKATV